MRHLKSRFWYDKGKRNGVLSLLLIIVVLQIIFVFFDFSSDDIIDTNSKEIQAFKHQINNLKNIEIENRKSKIFLFNPNYITDYKGYKLGMSIIEIDRLLHFRKQKKFVNSAKEFQQITKVSDSLLSKISPYFKFPDWVIKQKNKKASPFINEKKIDRKKIKTTIIDLNLATETELKTVIGVGEKLSKRIVKYRKKIQGFSFGNQLYEVWGLDTILANKVLSVFKIFRKPKIKKININTATFKVVLKNPYIDYKLCKKIFEYRDEVAELQDISELKNIDSFPAEKYQRIILYLTAK